MDYGIAAWHICDPVAKAAMTAQTPARDVTSGVAWRSYFVAINETHTKYVKSGTATAVV